VGPTEAGTGESTVIDSRNGRLGNLGEPRDWERIVRDHGPMVFTTAWRILGQAADAEDVVQDVFMEVQKIRVHVRCWPALLRRLATFRSLDRLRQRKSTTALDGLSLFSRNGDPEADAMEKELADRLRQAIAQLPEREGTVCCLRFFDELSYDEIAEHLAISRGAVAAALHKARAKLECLLAEPVHGEVI
jgi:RNA polymerase sigma-70 factor (ECF subfamily)